jgi:pyrimidine-nucleoside phosphorylase
MLPVEVIARKRDGGVLSSDEIRQFIADYTDGRVADEQMAAWAMAVYLRGMTSTETAALTDALRLSGQQFEWPSDAPPRLDKHSTGGVGDKVSLVLAPLLACCGVWVPMLSGRGLGATGGTLDKLCSIPGFRVDLGFDEILRALKSVGCVITGTTPGIAPADRKLYALRDITATVASIPLITASIMGKKLAEGLNGLVLDVKWGRGAFMKERAQARALAQQMVAAGQRLGVPTSAVISDMNQPLGKLCGNAAEVIESIAVLRGDGPADVRALTLRLGAEVLVAAGLSSGVESATTVLQGHLDSGCGFERFEQMVAAQGGRLAELPALASPSELASRRKGSVAAIDTEALGLAIVELGGGRRQPGDQIDPTVGLEYLVRLGDHVEVGQPWIRVFCRPEQRERVRHRLEAALLVTDEPVAPPPLILADGLAE